MAATDAAYKKVFAGLNPSGPFPLPQITTSDPATGAPLDRSKFTGMFSKELVTLDPDAMLKASLDSTKKLAVLEAEREQDLEIAKQKAQNAAYEEKTAPYIREIITFQLEGLFREIVQKFFHPEHLTTVMQRLRWGERFKSRYGLLCDQLWRENPKLVANQSPQMVLAMNTFIYALRSDIVTRAGFNLTTVNADVDVRLADNGTIQVTYDGTLRFVPISSL